jgi:hypothetical protein
VLHIRVEYRFPTGQGKLEKVRKFDWSGKVRKKKQKFGRKPGKMIIPDKAIEIKYLHY